VKKQSESAPTTFRFVRPLCASPRALSLSMSLEDSPIQRSAPSQLQLTLLEQDELCTNATWITDQEILMRIEGYVLQFLLQNVRRATQTIQASQSVDQHNQNTQIDDEESNEMVDGHSFSIVRCCSLPCRFSLVRSPSFG
jgi:hypothetical protein